ncbi:MAG: RsmD family RNA methyltransferase [Duodenibacillus sp.]|nr:RsmD family RNA methyltransferase [Duodenibacillus sp.]
MRRKSAGPGEAARAGKKPIRSSLPTRAGGAGQVRIVGGKFKRSLIPVRDREGLRPTPERVRETLFDWLYTLVGGVEGRACLDMFAGSGALGLEAASRGAARVVSIELDAAAAAAVRAAAARLGAGALECVRGDAFAWTGRCAEKFDVVFIDPPFACGWQMKAAAAARAVLAEGGLVYIESDAEVAEEDLAALGLASVRRGRAGAVRYLLACLQ